MIKELLMTVINFEMTVKRPQYDRNNLIVEDVVSGGSIVVYGKNVLFDDSKTLKNTKPCMEKYVKLVKVIFLLFIIPPRGFLRHYGHQRCKQLLWQGFTRDRNNYLLRPTHNGHQIA